MGSKKIIALASTALILTLAVALLWRTRQSNTLNELGSEPTGASADVLVEGTVEAAESAADMTRQIRTVFVILKDENARAPYAVRRLTNSENSHKLAFSLSRSDVMMPGAIEPQNPVLKIRFDSDGDPMTERPGDVIASAQGFPLGVQDMRLTAHLLEKPTDL